MTRTDEIQQLIAKGKTDAAINQLMAETKSISAEWHGQAVLLSARYEQWRKADRLGMVDTASELNKINAALIDLANAIAPTGHEGQTAKINITHKKSAKKWGVWGLLGVCLVVLGLVLVNVLKNDSSHDGDKATNDSASLENASENPAQKAKKFNIESSMDTWYSNIQPFGVKCQMTIKEINQEAKNPTTTYLKVNLSVKNVHDGSGEAQLTSYLFLLESDGAASITESNLSVLSILPGETKTVELIFSVANTAKKLQLIVKEDSNAQTIIPFVLH